MFLQHKQTRFDEWWCRLQLVRVILSINKFQFGVESGNLIDQRWSGSRIKPGSKKSQVHHIFKLSQVSSISWTCYSTIYMVLYGHTCIYLLYVPLINFSWCSSGSVQLDGIFTNSSPPPPPAGALWSKHYIEWNKNDNCCDGLVYSFGTKFMYSTPHICGVLHSTVWTTS